MQQEEGVSLIDLINGTKDFFSEMKKKWLLVTIIVCTTSGLTFLYSFLSKAKYTADSSMMLENSKSGGAMSGALALATQFGMMSGSSSSNITEDK